MRPVLRYITIYHDDDDLGLSLGKSLGLCHAESYRALYTLHWQAFW
jgi:hypothetical protein